jgi:rhamnose transport system permease protein
VEKQKSSLQKLIVKIFRTRELAILVLMILIMALVSLRTSAFFNLNNFKDILLDISMVSIVAMGQMLVMVTTGIDISVGSILAVSAMAVGSIVRSNPEVSPLLAIFIGLLIGIILGGFNGFVVTLMKIPPIITTLGTLSFFRGLVYIISGGTWVMAHQLPDSIKEFSIRTTLGLPFLVLFALFLGILFYFFANRVPIGRQIFAIGCNYTAAVLAGIRVKLVNFIVYVISGSLAGIAGVMWLSRYAIAANGTATGFELQTVAACVIGGVSVFGGSGTIPGVFMGAFFIGMINNAINLIGISEFWKQAFYGLAIILAVITDAIINNRLSRRKRNQAI